MAWEGRDAFAGRWLAVVGSGLVGGLAAAAALALPGYLGLVRGVTGAASSPWMALSGYLLAALVLLGCGFVAGRPARNAAAAGATAGAVAGYVAYVVIGGAAASVYAAAPFWDAVATRPTEAEGVRQLALVVSSLFLAQATALLVLIAAGGALGATGSVAARLMRDRTPAEAETHGLTALGSAATAGGITNAIVAVVVAIALWPLVPNMIEALATDAGRALVVPATVLVPVSAYLATTGALAALGARATWESARHVDSPEGARQANFVALVGIGVPVTAALLGAARIVGGAWLAAFVASAGLALILYGGALRTAARWPRPGLPEAETRTESVAAGITDALALGNPMVALALHAGLGTAVVVVPWIAAATARGNAPDTAEAVATLFQVAVPGAGVAFVASPVLLALAHVGLAALVARRRAPVAGAAPAQEPASGVDQEPV